MLIEFIGLIIFVLIFFKLIGTDQTFFENKLRMVQIELGVTLFLSVFLFWSAGFTWLLLFFLFWAGVATGSYFIYVKYNQKIGFIGSSFCLFFTIVYFYFELFLLNFNF